MGTRTLTNSALALALILSASACLNSGNVEDSGTSTADTPANQFGQFSATGADACVYQTESLVTQSWCLPKDRDQISGLLTRATLDNPQKASLLLGKIGTPVTEVWNVKIGPDYQGVKSVFLPVKSWGYQLPATTPGATTPAVDPTGTAPSSAPGTTNPAAAKSETDAVAYAQGQKWVVGTANYTFDPALEAKREQAVVIAMEAYAKSVTKTAVPATTRNPFVDVSSDHWAAPHIAAAQSLGLIFGVGGNRFGTGESMTRGQMMALLAALAKKMSAAPGHKAFPPATHSDAAVTFSDLGGNYYEAAVNDLSQFCAVPATVTNGDTESFGGATPITLGQAVNAIVTMVKCSGNR